jgi:hypothetical protein
LILTETHTRTSFDVDVETRRDDEDADYSGWWCVQTDPWPCPAPGCDVVQSFMTAAHLIVVWPRRDDIELLNAAHDAQQFRRNPKIVEYEPDFGRCIPYDVWLRIGRPVHGQLQRPDDMPYRRI